MYSSVALSIFTLLYNRSPEVFHLAKLKLQQLAIPSLPPTANYHSTFCFYEFDFSRDLIQEYLSFCVCHFTWRNVLKVHPCCSMCQNFLHFKGWITFHSMYRPHFAYSFICDGHLVCFYLLVAVKTFAINMSAQISLREPAFNPFGCTPRSGMT